MRRLTLATAALLAVTLAGCGPRAETAPGDPAPPPDASPDDPSDVSSNDPSDALVLSGVDLFWATADRLAAGEVLDDADWDAFFEHPGYAITERSGQRKGPIRHCITAAFVPDGDLADAKANLPEGEGRRSLVGRVCDHIAAIRDHRSEVTAYIEGLDGRQLLDEANAAAGAYLPEGVLDRVDRPTAYVLLFEQQGFGRDGVIVLDGYAMMTQPAEQNVQFIAHEFHHAYRDAVAEVEPAPTAASLVFALDRIVNEGSASMLDKASYVRTGRIPHGFPPPFLDLVAAAPERLAAIDTALAGLERTPDGYQAAAAVVRGNSPWGGHLNGTYMAIAIEDAFGRNAVVNAMISPVRFFTTYQRAAERLGEDHFRFSDDAMAALGALPEAPVQGAR